MANARRAAWAGAGLLGLAGATASAQEITLQNDSIVNGSNAAICICFDAGEEVATWLTSPCDGNIVAIQIYWRSEFGGAPQSLEDAILIYNGSNNFPVPGALKEEFLGPLLTDGGLNEYRYQDENQTIPISVPVSAGEEFVVSLAFFNSNNGDFFAPSVVSDRDGATPGKNAVFTNNFGGWRSNEFLGVNGDWFIRAIVDCDASVTGACCLPDGGCAELTAEECAAMSGSWSGPGTTCAEVECTGACYITSTQSCFIFDKATCDGVSGHWAGPGTTECVDPCPADVNSDGVLDNGDIQAFVTAFLASNLSADFNGDGVLDNGDIQAFVEAFLAGC